MVVIRRFFDVFERLRFCRDEFAYIHIIVECYQMFFRTRIISLPLWRHVYCHDVVYTVNNADENRKTKKRCEWPIETSRAFRACAESHKRVDTNAVDNFWCMLKGKLFHVFVNFVDLEECVGLLRIQANWPIAEINITSQ